MMNDKPLISPGLINFTAALIATSLSVYILIISNAILLPFLVAIVIWFIITRFASIFRRTPIIGSKMPEGLAIFLAVLLTMVVLYLFVSLLSTSVQGIIDQAPLYQNKLNELVLFVNRWLGTTLEFNQLLAKINLTTIFSNLALTVTNIASNLGVIIVYVLFITLEYKTFTAKLRALAGSEKNFATSHAILEHIDKDINTYIRIKTGVSLLTAISSYIALEIYSIPHAQFWAILIFILNFVPTIGSIVAVAATLIAISIEFTSLSSLAILGGILIVIQVVIGNLIEPKLMGKNLNLSPLVILLSLAFWGSIWGIVGMFLCIPLMTIINIVLSKFPKTRKLSAMLAAEPELFADK